jgi:drug/metabolite transporter (DMT)-like permease
MNPPDSPGNRRYWLDEPAKVTKIVWGLVILCALLAAADFFYLEETHFPWEAWPAFYAIYGFLGAIALVLAAKELRKLVRRDEDYYDRR